MNESSLPNARDELNNDNNGDESSRIQDRVSAIDHDDKDDNDKPSGAVTAAAAASSQIQEVTDRALRFLSHASNETLGACLVGLGATTYFVLGRVGLLLIGMVGGIALHATWDSDNSLADRVSARQAEQRKRREIGLEVVQRVFKWKESKGAPSDSDGSDDELKPLAAKKADFSALRPETAAALNIFADAIIRDYVKWWYSPVLPGEDSFPMACRQTLVAFVLSLCNHLSRKRPVDTFLDFVTNSSSIVIVFLNELAAALNASPNTAAPEAVASYLELKPDSSLANVLDPKHQEKKLNLVANDILITYLDPKAYACPPVQIFLKQVLSKLILSMTIDSCSKPEFINQWIVYLLEDGEPEIMNAIDAGVEGSAAIDAKKSQKHVAMDDNAANSSSSPEAVREHRRNASRTKAEEAMDEAMQEAKRLSQLIAQEDEARKEKETSTDDVSATTTQGITTPSSSQSDMDDSGKKEEAKPAPAQQGQFTTFDQILPANSPTALSFDADQARLKPAPVLTLYKATINIFDDSTPTDKNVLRSKPSLDYMIQIEPASSSFPGWMIVRKYADFETLHEVLRRISVITGTRFNESHSTLPSWKNHTKASLRTDLERYLSDAVRLQPLAESEGMKRFLDKDQGATRSPGGSKGFGWPTPAAFDQMGKSMMDTLTKAPTQVAGGGKAIFGGVTSILGGKRNSIASQPSNHSASRSSISLAPTTFLEDSYMGSMGSIGMERQSSESIRSVPAPLSRTSSLSKRVPSATQSIHKAEPSVDWKPRTSLSSPRASLQGQRSGETSRPPSSSGLRSPMILETQLNLPPPPSDIPDDYASPTAVSHQPPRVSEDMAYVSPENRSKASPKAASITNSPRTSTSPEPATTTKPEPEKAPSKTKARPPINEQETQVAVELLFAVITELYTLSSAWNIRRTLLNAAKSFLLRPGNPQLEAIRVLIQESVIDSNTSDPGLAAHILKIRENALPTPEELKKWPVPPTDKEKEELRIKARKLLVERGMPQALTSVMGAAASGEALGKVFDCLQVESVARGLIFGITLQALRAVAQ